MLDLAAGLLFMLLYEIFSWPLRLALAPIPMSADIRRMISRLAGPGIICFVSWIGGHYLVPIGFVSIWMWYGLFAYAGWQICKWQKFEPDLRALFHPLANPKTFRRDLFIELASIFMFVSYLLFRRLAPEISVIELPGGGSGSEKFDNAMVFWSAWYASALPPEDYWLSGHPQAYYYFGHFFWAWIGRAGLFPGEWVITLAMARLVLLIWESAYLLIRSFGARAVSAAIGAFFVAWAGNPHAVQMAMKRYEEFTGRKNEPVAERRWLLNRRYMSQVFKNPKDFFGGYDYWKSSRALRDEDITEYLAWTAILGDFHAHHLSVPWMIGWIALILSGDKWFKFRACHLRAPPDLDEGDTPEAWTRRATRHRFGLWLLCFIVLGVISTISNLWVAPMVGLASLGILLWRWRWGRKGIFLRAGVIASLALAMLAGIYISKGTLSTPLDASAPKLSPDASFIEKLVAKSPLKPLPNSIRSADGMIVRHWGFQMTILLVGSGVAVFSWSRPPRIMKRARRRRPPIWVPAALALAVFSLILKYAVLPNEPVLIWVAVASVVFTMGWGKRTWLRPNVLVYVCGSCLMLGALEVFFIDDAYAGSYERYNSYFKFSYPIWPIMTAASWICVQRLWQWRTALPFRLVFRGTCIIAIPFIMTMVIFGMPARIIQARSADASPRSATLDAFAWLGNIRGYEAEALMLNWIRKNVPPGTRIAEAVDPQHISYTYSGRIASLAGRPIPLGWEHHEGQWRSFADKGIGENKSKLMRIFNAPSASEMRAAAQDLGVRFVVLGKPEIQIFGRARIGHIYETLLKAGIYRAGFPENKPEVFVFEIPSPGNP